MWRTADATARCGRFLDSKDSQSMRSQRAETGGRQTGSEWRNSMIKHISVPRPAGPDHQHGVADITYIVIATGFVYLVAILDAWSRRVVGYAIGKRIDARLALAALRAAIAVRRPPAGCIHHSDGGSQYAAEDYRASSPSTASRVRWVAAATHTTTPRLRAS